MAMTRDELIELGYKIKNFKGTEEEHYEILKLFSDNVPHPNGAKLFYYPENFNARKHDLSKYNPTVEEVVDKALSYKPIQL
jgi:hypothetical protein